MNNRTRIIIGILAFCCIVGFSMLLIFNHAVRGVILDPLIAAVNAFRYALGYLPQDLEWLITLLAVSVVVLVTFASRLPKRARPKYVPFIPPFPKEGPAMQFARILDKANHNKFRRERVVLEMRDLAAHTIAYHKGVSVEEAGDLLDTQSWTTDASVRDFLSLDKHRAGKHDQREFQKQVDYALTHIEQMYQEV
jgi:hypothetical protein